MMKSGLTPNAISYAALVEAWSRADHMERAEEAFAAMKSNGLRPSAEAYNYLARGLAKNGNVARIDELAGEMAQEGIHQNTFFLSSQLRTYAAAVPPRPDKAIRAFKDAAAAGIQLNDHVLRSLALSVGQEEAEALNVYYDSSSSPQRRTAWQGHSKPLPKRKEAFDAPYDSSKKSKSPTNNNASRPWRSRPEAKN